MTYRVVQWTTGNVGRQSVRAIVAHPELELVGCFAHGEDKLEIRPPRGFEGKSFEDFMQLGMIATAMPAINAIPHFCRATPGIRSYRDLPLLTGAGLVSR